MAGDRTSALRRSNRNYASSPYARPSSRKSSGSGILSTLLSYLPFGKRRSQSRSPSPQPDEDEASADRRPNSGARSNEKDEHFSLPIVNPAAGILAERGRALAAAREPISSTSQAPLSGSSTGPGTTASQNAWAQPPLTNSPTFLPPPPQSKSQTLSSQPQFSFASIQPQQEVPGSRTASEPSVEHVPSSSRSIQLITQFLTARQGHPINQFEIAGMVHMLQEHMEDMEDREPVRFSVSPSGSQRGVTPLFPFLGASHTFASFGVSQSQNIFNFSGQTQPLNPSASEPTLGASAPAIKGTSASSSNNQASAQSQRMLSRNPNGTYQWTGAGSAKPRNRFQSAGLGNERRKKKDGVRLPAPVAEDVVRERKQMADGAKKRRVEGKEDIGPENGVNGVNELKSPLIGSHSTSTSQSSLSSHSKSTASGPGPSASQGQTPATPARLRIPNATAPAVPSPLRQTWSQDSPSPPQLVRGAKGRHNLGGASAVQTASSGNTSSSNHKQITPPKDVEESPKPQPTYAAALIHGLIEAHSPKGKKSGSDDSVAFTNPYQSALPVSNVPRPKKGAVKKRRASGEKKDEKWKEKEVSKEDGYKSKETERMNVDGSGASASDVNGVGSLSQQRVIEATVPKGAKRSRPPPELEAAVPIYESQTRRTGRDRRSPEPVFVPFNGPIPSSVGLSRPSPAHPTITLEEAQDDGEKPLKRSRISNHTVNGNGGVTVEEISEEEEKGKKVVRPGSIMEPEEREQLSGNSSNNSGFTLPTSTSSSNTPAPTPKPAFGLKSSAPKAPSKLRYSFQADKDSASSASESEATSPIDYQARDAWVSTPTLTTKSAKAAGKEREQSSKDGTSSGPPPAPKPSFAIPKTSPSVSFATPPTILGSIEAQEGEQLTFKSTEDVKRCVHALPASSLPTYDFSFSPSNNMGIGEAGPGPNTIRAREAAKGAEKATLPVYVFFDSVGRELVWEKDLKVPNFVATPGPRIATSSGASTSDSASGTTISSTPPTGGFDYAAAGMKPPVQANDGSWRCSLCDCQNTASSMQCLTCEESRPGATSTPTPGPAPTSLRSSSGGPAMPTVPLGGLKMPEAPSSGFTGFGGAFSTFSNNTSSSTTTTNGFGSGGGGFTPSGMPAVPSTPLAFGTPSTSSTAASSSTNNLTLKFNSSSNDNGNAFGSSGFTPNTTNTTNTSNTSVSSSSSTSGGFDWAAAGLAPVSAGKWKCHVCDCLSEDNAEKCCVCDEPRRR